MLRASEGSNGFWREDGPSGVLFETLKSGRLELVKGVEGFVELAGRPDMVLEVVSPNSVRKDTQVLPSLYYRAGVSEYWLVDVRGKRLRFDVLRRGPAKFVATRKRAGWVESTVFGKTFKLTRDSDELGHPEYTLSVR